MLRVLAKRSMPALARGFSLSKSTCSVNLGLSKEKGYNWFPFDTMEQFMVDVFVGMGVPVADAKVSAEVLIGSDKRGIDSHGVGRMKPIYYDRLKNGQQQAVTKFDILREGPTTAVVDGNHGMGHVVGKRSMQMAIDKAKEYGMGMVVARNSTHYGFAGYYGLQASQQGMIGITGTNARPSIAPTFGVENMLGTNPLVFGMPSDDPFPFVIDCATSVTQRGKLEVLARLKQNCPPGWVINSQGEPATGTVAILDELVKGTAALTPLGGLGDVTAGYKGYGYAAVVEVLSAALQQGSFLKGLLGFENGKRVPYRLGHFFMAINVESFCDLKDFKKTTGEIMRAMRASKKAPGHDRIYTPGEKEHEAWLERRDLGVPLNEELQGEMLAMAKELNLEKYIKMFS